MGSGTSNRYSVTRLRVAQLRWWLLAGLTLAVLSAPTFLAIPLPLPPLLGALLALACFNAVAHLRVAAGEFAAAELVGQLAVDLVGMGVLLYLSGGAANPLVSLLLLPVAVAALSLPIRWVGVIVALAVGIYSFLMLYSLPLPIADVERATRLHLGGMWLTFVVSALLLAWFVSRMTASLRERDALLAAAREQALRDAQVLALGQLAAGAAHELGTPLATIKVLAGELAGDRRLPSDARDDLVLLQRQIDICKDIVGGMTHQAGIERAETARPMAVDRWLDKLLSRWRTLWPRATCILDVQSRGERPRPWGEAAIEQGVMNLLNNAAKVAPQGIRLVVNWDAKNLMISVHDQGPGFPAEVLRHGGDEPLAAHAGGKGIGLWLTRSAVERGGGRLVLENGENDATGGIATIVLPLGENAWEKTDDTNPAGDR